jgi:hypothetical protein
MCFYPEGIPTVSTAYVRENPNGPADMLRPCLGKEDMSSCWARMKGFLININKDMSHAGKTQSFSLNKDILAPTLAQQENSCPPAGTYFLLLSRNTHTSTQIIKTNDPNDDQGFHETPPDVRLILIGAFLISEMM